MVLEKTLESPFNCKEIQTVHSEGDQPWDFSGRMILKLKLQHFGHLMQRADSFEKTLMLGKIEGQEKKGMTDNEMVGWHHKLPIYPSMFSHFLKNRRFFLFVHCATQAGS